MADLLAQITAVGVTSNAQLSGTPVPNNAAIIYAIFRETAGNVVSISLGTSSGASDVMPIQNVAASGVLMVPINAFNKAWFSAFSPQAIYVTSASWGSASINVSLVYMIGP